VWKGAYCLQRYLAANSHLVAGKAVCELGAGTGFLSMSAHLLGASRVVATDKFLRVLTSNIRNNHALLQSTNSCGCLECSSCDWEEVQRTETLPDGTVERFDLVLASDCIYYHKKYAAALLSVLILLLSRHDRADCPPPSLLLSQSYRGAPDVESFFFEGAARAGLRCVQVSQDENSPDRAALKKMDVVIWRIWHEPADECAPLGLSERLPRPAPASPSGRAPFVLLSLSPILELRRVTAGGRSEWVFSTPCE
jgi:hypothetical protein